MSPTTSAKTKANPLWDFMRWAYLQPGVEKACLALQNRLNADVNIVLFCVWLAYRGAGNSHLAKHLAGALKLSRDWQRTLVEPLRDCRTNMKTMLEGMSFSAEDQATAEALRERIKACELEMEKLQTIAVYSLVEDGSDDGVHRSPQEQRDDAHNNLTVYFAATGVKVDPLGQSHIMRILTAVFGG